MTVLIVGSAGLIGRKLVVYHLNQGDTVVGVDPYRPSIEHERYAHFRTDIHMWRPDVFGPIDIVYHLAGSPCPSQYLERPRETVHLTIDSCRKTLDIAGLYEARYFLASTSEVYGDPEEDPQREEYTGNINPVDPRSVYSEAKRVCETLTMAYHTQFGLDVRIGRIFNAYGPALPTDTRIIPSFLRACHEERPITIYGNGLQTRSYCYIDDMVSGIVALTESDYTPPVNIGNPDEYYTVQEVAALAMEVTGRVVEIERVLDADMVGPLTRRPNVSRLRKETGWQPQIVLREGLAKTYSEYTKLNAFV